MSRPSPDHLLQETAQIAHHFHWSLDTILDLEHRDRQRFLDEIATMNDPGTAA
jgi:hypothetical protein